MPPSESALKTAGEFDGSEMPDANQAIIFTEYDLLLDSAASVRIVSNSHLQTEIRASRYLKINGIQRAERLRSAPENYHPYNNWPEKSDGGHLDVSEYKSNIIIFFLV